MRQTLTPKHAQSNISPLWYTAKGLLSSPGAQALTCDCCVLGSSHDSATNYSRSVYCATFIVKVFDMLMVMDETLKEHFFKMIPSAAWTRCSRILTAEGHPRSLWRLGWLWRIILQGKFLSCTAGVVQLLHFLAPTLSQCSFSELIARERSSTASTHFWFHSTKEDATPLLSVEHHPGQERESRCLDWQYQRRCWTLLGQLEGRQWQMLTSYIWSWGVLSLPFVDTQLTVGANS